MTPIKKQRMMLLKLKKQVEILKRNEKKTRRHLRVALKKMKRMGRVYKIKLIQHKKSYKDKVAAAELATYARVCALIQKETDKRAAANEKASVVTSKLKKLEKKFGRKATKVIKSPKVVRKKKLYF